jgi:hypothetical protein
LIVAVDCCIILAFLCSFRGTSALIDCVCRLGQVARLINGRTAVAATFICMHDRSLIKQVAQ